MRKGENKTRMGGLNNTRRKERKKELIPQEREGVGKDSEHNYEKEGKKNHKWEKGNMVANFTRREEINKKHTLESKVSLCE